MTREELIRAIHRSGRQMVLAVTGGGASAIGELLRVPGGSASVLEAIVPYHARALAGWLGAEPEQACSSETARQMAMAAFQRARQLADAATPTGNILGVGCTASLASDRPKRGEHRFFVAIQTGDTTWCTGWKLEKGARSRAEEEEVVTGALLVSLALAANLTPKTLEPALPKLERIVSEVATAVPPICDLLTGSLTGVALTATRTGGTVGRTLAAGKTPSPAAVAVFPGAFHPLHAGHREIARIAAARLALPVQFEISIYNVDKAPLDYYEIEQRTRQFEAGETVWLTRAPTFVKKAELFPGATFLVGADTITRIGAPKYYGGDERQRDEAIAAIAANGCRFLVFGRVANEAFRALHDLALPPALRVLCDEVPESEFRADVSSTELRQCAQEADDSV